MIFETPGPNKKDLFQYCREQQQAASNADVDIHDVMVNELEDVIAVHDFEHMVKRQVRLSSASVVIVCVCNEEYIVRRSGIHMPFLLYSLLTGIQKLKKGY